MISRTTMAHRTTIYAREIRDRLRDALGMKCALCGETDQDKLQFDHIRGAHFVHNRLSYSARMKRYEREHELGLIRLLCGDCNRAERRRDDSGRHIRTIEAVNGLIPLTPDMPF